MENRIRQITKPYPTRGVWCPLLILLLILLLPATAFSQSILWKTENNGHTLYIMGSIHVLKPSHYPLPPAMEAAYADSDLVAFEVDISESESKATGQLFMRAGMYQNGQTLQKNISRETFADLQHYLATIQISAALFRSMKPPLCAMTITIMEMQRLGFEAKYGLDKYFNEKARTDGKKIASLETIDFQVKLFFDQTLADQELFLKQTLAEISLMRGMMQRMEEAWVTGDATGLHTLLYESFINFPGFYERLLLQRNRNWISKIKTLHDQNEKILIVVGAAHLVGKGSVIDLLEQQGYSFTQL